MITRTVYCSWQGDPALLVHYDDGRIHGFVNYGDTAATWQAAHGADISTKAHVIGQAVFKQRWPDLTLPNSVSSVKPTE